MSVRQPTKGRRFSMNGESDQPASFPEAGPKLGQSCCGLRTVPADEDGDAESDNPAEERTSGDTHTEDDDHDDPEAVPGHGSRHRSPAAARIEILVERLSVLGERRIRE